MANRKYNQAGESLGLNVSRQDVVRDIVILDWELLIMTGENDASKKIWFCRFHFSTLCISVIVILIPWALISLPGSVFGGGGTSGFSTSHYRHGWPFISFYRQTVKYDEVWVNQRFLRGVKPANYDWDKEATKQLNDTFLRFNSANWMFDLQFSEAAEINDSLRIEDEERWEHRFWSDSNRWPFLGEADGEAFRINWVGFGLNLFILGAMLLLFIPIIEYRMQTRGGHFVFKLSDLFVVMLVCAMAFGWVAAEYQRANSEKLAVDHLFTSVIETDGDVYGERKNSLPLLVSKLLDYRSRLPFDDMHLFRPVDHVCLELLGDTKSYTAGKKSNAIVKSINNSTFPIWVELNVDANTLPILQGIARAECIKVLEIYFCFDLDWDDAIDGHRDNIDLDLKLILPGAESVTIWLQDDELDQVKQLQTIVGSIHLKRLCIHGVTKQGAEYLNSMRGDLPEKTLISFSDEGEAVELLPPLNRLPDDAW